TDAHKLASLDLGREATPSEDTVYKTALFKLGTICSQSEPQLARMVYAGATKLSGEGISISSSTFMADALEVMEPLFPSPNGAEDCASDFADLMGAIRTNGG